MPKVKSTRIERAQRSGKTVTVVTFHGAPTDDAKHAWLKMAKNKLGVGGTIEDENVILQGDQRERLCSISEK
ncbi:MAG: translation initiation factor [Proteobacteria bacterium]|nr:translation initiation factor [Pseudomonadota bacterium]